MSDPIAEYHQWKKQGGDLRTRARQAMEARFKELLTEAVQLAEEYRADFGSTLTPPAAVTVFKFKAGAKKAAKKTAPAAKMPTSVSPPATKTSPQIKALEKQLAAARKKLAATQEKGASTKNIEDRIYELEDDLRLAQHGA